MSQANVEIVGRSIDALNRRDLDRFVDLTTPDYELLPAMTGFAGTSFRGRAGVESYFAELHDAWEEFRVIGEEFHDLGDRVLVLMRVEGRGRGSGIPVDALQAIIVDLRGEKISRTRSYLDRAEALRAAGLAE
ncbi:MAG TPA: nuclear transport factor 2 family protein [Solirubrobacteraceae bacterium]|jgi:ketosteroid isomerase-like protein